MILTIFILIYFGLPAFSILMTGRKLTLKGWILFLLFWPIGWLIFGPEELP